MSTFTHPLLSNPGFSTIELTRSINLLPNNYGRLQEMNLMPVRGVTQRSIMIEHKNGVLNLLPTKPVGSPGSLGRTGKRKAFVLQIPHIPHDDVVLPDEVDGVRSFGTTDGVDPVISRLNDKLQTMKNKHSITLEYFRTGALKGLILDADGSVLCDIFSNFGITQKTIDFALTTATTAVITKCLDVSRYIEDNLGGDVMTGIHILCSPAFFDALTTHPKVAEAFMYFRTQQPNSGDHRAGFRFGGLLFEEYRGQASDIDGNVRKFIPENEAIAFPVGTNDVFSTYFAPADFNETVNTVGLPYYAKLEPIKFDRGYELHTQSNPLPMCNRPSVLVRLTMAEEWS